VDEVERYRIVRDGIRWKAVPEGDPQARCPNPECNRYIPIYAEDRMELFIRMLPAGQRKPTQGTGETYYHTYRHKSCGATLEWCERPRQARAA
jgi:hypothetical protein